MTAVIPDASVTAPSETGSDPIDRARAGDVTAFDRLCLEHGDRLFRQALGLCRDRAAAEDLVQETLIAAWRSLGRYHGGCRFFTWLCSILIHRHRTAWRRRWSLGFSGRGARSGNGAETEADWLPECVADPSASPELRAEAAERAAAVRASLDRLPAKQREVVFLRFYAEDSLEGIAAALGCPVGTVKSRLFHGLERLRRMKAVAEQRNR